MGRISIFYDKDLKEQFFMVRGDERYARSTKVILEDGEVQTSSYDFSVELSVNVLRDVGESSIVIYDNDLPVGLIKDWTSTNNGATIEIDGLSYDIDHNFTAEYTGNTQCSPSLSNSITVNVHDTNRATSNLTISSGIQYNPNASLTKTVTLTNANNAASYNNGQELDVYYDDEFVETITTSDGTATFSIDDVGAIGSHTIKVEYAGSEHLTSKTVTMNLSVGYLLEIVSVPSIVFSDDYYVYSARLTNCLNQPVSSQVVYMDSDNSFSTNTEAQMETNNDGIAEIYSMNSPNTTWKFFTEINGVRYVSEEFTTNVVVATSMAVSASPNILHNNENTVVSMQTNSRIEGTPIRVVQTETGINTYVYTDANGLATINVTGNGIGTKTLTAQYGSITQSITLTDYLQYWQPKNNHNRNYVGTVNDLNNLFRITSSDFTTLALYVPNNIDYELVMSGFSTSKSAKFNFLSGFQVDNNMRIIATDIVGTNYGQQSHSNETWKVIRQDGTVSLYKGNTLMTTFANQEECAPAFLFEANYSQVTTNGLNYYTYASTNFDFTKLTIRGI